MDARARRALSDYARNVTQIVDETEQTSKSFFGKLSNPGSLSVTEFVNEVNADRSAMDSYAGRVESLGTPGDMSHAQSSLELAYELRRRAMDKIAEKMSTALGDVGSGKASAAIAKQMQTLFGSDVLYAEIVRPEIEAVLESNGIGDSEVPASVFVPEGTKWLDEATVSAALGSVSGATGAATPGVHGLGLFATSVNGTELVAESATAVVVEGTPEVEVQVQNQGESTENGIAVSVTVNGGRAVQATIESIEAGETATVSIPLTPAPKGEATLEVDVATVPGEQILENNKATYTVTFE
ncbi:MAG: CARDB domain-containing protein [Chloroflexota bacterium]